MKYAMLLAALSLVAACGGNDEPAAAPATVTETATSTVTETVEPPAPTVDETCDAVVDALGGVKFRDPTRYQPTVIDAIPDVAKVLATAPPRVEAALDGMLNAMIRFASKDPADMASMVDGASAFLQSITTLTHACGRD